ncbi:MAG: nickel ABC transporter substrate-binding protein [Solibacillus sp.]
MKKIGMLLLAAMMLLVAACQSDEASEAEEKDNVLVMSWPKDIGGEVNPHLYSPNEMFAQAMLYDPLVVYNNDGSIAPGLAEVWDMSEDGKTYTFTLREGVNYSDGSLLTADNVKRNFDTVTANIDAHSWLEVVAVIESVEVVGDMQVAIHLKNAYYPFLQELALIRPLRMLADAGFPESGHTADGITKAIGTGPWILSAYEKDRYAEFTRNENYWGEKPALEKVVVQVMGDSQSRMMALEKGDIDLIFGSGQLAPVEFHTSKEQGKYITEVSEPLSTRLIAMNSLAAVTDQKEVRQAFQYLLDRDTIVEHVLNGLEQPATTLFSPGFPYSELDVTTYAYNVEQAVAILEAAGWVLNPETAIREKDGQALAVTFAFNSSDQIQKSIAEYMQGEWKKAGVDVQLVGEESQILYGRLKAGDFNLVFNDTWGAPYDPHMYMRTMTGEKQIGNFAMLGTASAKELEADILQVIRSTDEAERTALYKNILAMIQDEAMFLPISYRQNYLVANDVFTSLGFSPQQYEVPVNLYEMK